MNQITVKRNNRKFQDNRLWLQSPDWLTVEDNWTDWNRDKAHNLSTIAHQEVVVDTLESTQYKCIIQEIVNVLDLNRFDSFKKILRITAYAYVRSMLNTIIQNASITWINYTQKKIYLEIIQDSQTNLSNKSNYTYC